MLKKTAKKILIIVVAAILFVPLLFTFGCKVDYYKDSEIYSCYFYSVDGEEKTDGIEYYTLELRTDGKLITRYKTKKNSDSGKDDYFLQGNFLVVTGSASGNKYYDMIANEIIISEYIEKSTYVLAKFRLTKTAKEYNKTVYSRVSYSGAIPDEVGNLKYHLVCFEDEGKFSIFYRASERTVVSGTYTKTEEGYFATESVADSDDPNVIPREYFFEITEDGLRLEEIEGDGTEFYIFTQSAAPEENNEK